MAAQKWETLRELWFGRESTDSSGRSVPLIAALFIFSAFQNVEPQAVLLPTLTSERRLTPISDYLHDSLRPTLRPVIPSDARYTQTFDRYEWLSAMALADLRATWKGNGYVPDGFVGSYGWRYRMFTEGSPQEWSRKELARVGASWRLLRSGLFGGNPTRMEAADAAVAAIASGFSVF